MKMKVAGLVVPSCPTSQCGTHCHVVLCWCTRACHCLWDVGTAGARSRWAMATKEAGGPLCAYHTPHRHGSAQSFYLEKHLLENSLCKPPAEHRALPLVRRALTHASARYVPSALCATGTGSSGNAGVSGRSTELGVCKSHGKHRRLGCKEAEGKRRASKSCQSRPAEGLGFLVPPDEQARGPWGTDLSSVSATPQGRAAGGRVPGLGQALRHRFRKRLSVGGRTPSSRAPRGPRCDGPPNTLPGHSETKELPSFAFLLCDHSNGHNEPAFFIISHLIFF